MSIVLSKILIDIQTVEKFFNIELGPKSISQRMHENFTNNFLLSYINNDDIEANKALIEAAKLRKCLG